MVMEEEGTIHSRLQKLNKLSHILDSSIPRICWEAWIFRCFINGLAALSNAEQCEGLLQ